MIAQKAKELTLLVNRIKSVALKPLPSTRAADHPMNILDLKLPPKFDARRAEELRDLVDTFNSISLPKMFCGIDNEGLLHVTLMGPGASIQTGPTEVMHSADFIWRYNPVTGKYANLKDRTGQFKEYRDDA